MSLSRLKAYGRTSRICLLAALVVSSCWSLLFFYSSVFIMLLTSFDGWSFTLINTLLKEVNSSSSNFSLEQIKIDLWIRFLNVPRFHCMGACEFQFIYKSALVFLSTVASYSLFPVHVISKSRNVIFWFSLISCLNWMLGWWLLNFSKTNLIFEASIYAWVSSTYLFQWVYCFLIFFFFLYQGFI